MGILNQLAIRWRVVRRLRLAQGAARAQMRWRQRRLAGKGIEGVLPRSRWGLSPDWRERIHPLAGGEKRRECTWQEVPGIRFRGNAEWLESGAGRPLRYRRDLAALELFYHEFLTDGSLPGSEAWAVLERYLAGHQNRVSDGVLEWHPYTVSNRLAQWLRFLAQEAQRGEAIQVDRLAGECRLLTDYVDWLQERDIGANHLLKNRWAVALSDSILEADPGRREKSIGAYVVELETQLLADGGHYERCPMYHAKLLLDASILAPLLRAESEHFERIRDCVEKGQVWLERMRLSERTWANFNDSWDIPHLAEALWPDAGWQPETGEWHLKDSGFIRGNSSDGWRWILDGGGVGPAFNPGHCHSDLLSVIVNRGDFPFVVDPGTLHYSPNDERGFLKSCHAHNGPCLADRDHTELVGSFRMGRAATCDWARLEGTGGTQVAEAGHRGYPGMEIRRRVEVQGRTFRMMDCWKPAANRGYRPWMRLLLAGGPGAVRQLEIKADQVGFRLIEPGATGDCEVRIRIGGGLGGQGRFRVGECFHSPAFGRTAPALEVIFTTRSQTGACELETTATLGV